MADLRQRQPSVAPCFELRGAKQRPCRRHVRLCDTDRSFVGLGRGARVSPVAAVDNICLKGLALSAYQTGSTMTCSVAIGFGQGHGPTARRWRERGMT